MKTLPIWPILVLASTLSPASATLTQNLLAYWDFEGDAANDDLASGGNAYNGTLSGNAAASTAQAKAGTQALVLDGNGDYMTVGSLLDVNASWSVSAWFRPTVVPAGTGDANRYFVYESYSATVGYSLSFGLRDGTTGNTNFQVFTDLTPGPDVSRDTQIPDAAVPNIWHHVLESYDATTKTLRIYINGVAQTPISLGTNTFVTAGALRIGCARAATRFFNGAIDEVALWDRSLTPEEAQVAYQLGVDGEALTTEKYTVTLNTSPTGVGSVSGSGLYDLNEQVPISATPNPGYIFTGWTGDFSGQAASFTYTANANATATAGFAEDTADNDNDGLTNFAEIVTHLTNPDLADTDGDEIPDGAEITIGLSPTSSDATLVDFVRNNIAGGQAGAIALGTPEISRNPTTGVITLSLSLFGSADQNVWQVVDLSQPSVSMVPAADGWTVTLPAPSNTVDSYILLGTKP